MAAASCKEGVSEYYEDLLSALYKKEREHPLEETIAHYHAKREELKEVMDDCDCDYSNVIRSIGMNPDR